MIRQDKQLSFRIFQQVNYDVNKWFQLYQFVGEELKIIWLKNKKMILFKGFFKISPTFRDYWKLELIIKILYLL